MMINLFLYFIQSSIVFSLLYLIYTFFYSGTTFYGWNRSLLIAIPIVSLITPLSYMVISNESVILSFPTKISDFVYIEESSFDLHENISSRVFFTLEEFCLLIYMLISLFLLFKFIHSVWLVISLKKRLGAKKVGNLYFIKMNHFPTFSFFNWIFISQNQKDIDKSIVIEHEKAHAQLYHTLDLLLSEVYIVFFWFNPFVYLYRKSLKTIHEYQADAWVLKKNIKKSTYLHVLLQNIQLQSSNNLHNYFNQSVIKKRIDMITKKPTQKMYKLSYSLLLFCAVILCFAFGKPNVKSNFIPKLSTSFANFENPPSLFPIVSKSVKDISSYYGEKGRFSKETPKKIHRGIDIRAAIGTPIIATADGIVTKASMQKNWGNLIIINHNDGYQTWYAHLNGFNVKEKQSVKKGQVIGYVGNTGLSKGPHLHYEVRLNDTYLDPLDFIKD